MKFKLGRKPARHDKRTFKLRAYLPTLPPLPTTVDWGTKVTAWQFLLNDSLGDCTCACAGHMEMLWTSDAGTLAVPADSDILTAYEAIGGYQPGNPATDQGCAVLDVLNYWRQNGIAGRKILAYATLELTDQQQIMAAIALFGCAYFGVNLTNADITANEAGQEWSAPFNAADLIGGHAIPAVQYDADGVTFITWGARQRASWAWVLAHAEEAYACLSQDFISGTGLAPSGFNLAQLQTDLAAL